MVNENVGGTIVSLQVSVYGDITPGTNFKAPGKLPFHIKNISGDTVDVTIVGKDGCHITTPMDQGWNPEIVFEILNAPEGLQFGY